jgi:hypothetical protein
MMFSDSKFALDGAKLLSVRLRRMEHYNAFYLADDVKQNEKVKEKINVPSLP